MGEVEGISAADLERRLVRLERRERRGAALVAAAAALLLAGAAARPAPQGALDVVRAAGFEVIGPEGRPVAALRAGEDGPELVLLDPAGVARARLAHEPEQTALMISDGTGTTRVGVAQFAHGGGGVALHGEGSRGAAVLYLSGGEGSLRFFDGDGAVTLRIPAAPQ